MTIEERGSAVYERSRSAMVTTKEDLAVLGQRPTTRQHPAWRALATVVAVGGAVAWAVLLRPSDVGVVAYGIITLYVASVVTTLLMAAWSTQHPVDEPSVPTPVAGERRP